MKVTIALVAVSALLGSFIAVGPAEEITSDSAKRALARKMLEKYKANGDAIRTWTGKVEQEEVLEKVREGVTRTTRSTITFWADETSRANKTVREVHDQFEENRNGARTNLVRRTDSVLLKVGETYSFPSWFHPDAPHKRYLRQLLVGQDMKDLKDIFFFPALGAMNDGAYHGYLVDVFFPCLIETPKESLAKISMWREGNIVTVVDSLVKNGSLVLLNTRVFDLDRAANLIRFEYEGVCIDRSDSWECDYQQVDGKWIPKKTESTIEANGQGIVIHKKTQWRELSLNKDIAKELSPTTLGACRGDQAYNHKTDTLYRIDDDAYPEYQSQQ